MPKGQGPNKGRFVPGIRTSLAKRLFDRVDIPYPWPRNDSCWTWKGATTHFGHGVIGLGVRGQGNAMTHRVSWELHFGPVPDGLCVLHTCDNPPCVNPNHLWLGTRLDNNRDMIAKGRYRGGAQPRVTA
jgi:hypothetical protein